VKNNQDFFVESLKSDQEVVDYVRSALIPEMRKYQVPVTPENHFTRLSSAVFEGVSASLASGKRLLEKFKSLDQRRNLKISVGTSVSILNLRMSQDFVELFGFRTPKKITRIYREPTENKIVQLEFNNDPEDVWPRNPLASYNGELVMTSAFFPSARDLDQAVSVLQLSTPSEFTIRTNILESDQGKNKKQAMSKNRFGDPLTGWHIVYRNSGNPVQGSPSFDSRDAAQKYLMTKMFSNHQDYKVVHTSKAGMSENTGVTDFNPPSQDDSRKELVAKYHKSKNSQDAEAARRAGATQKELQGVTEGKEATLEKKIQAKRDALTLAREQRKGRGNKQQGSREIKLQAEIDKLSNELTQLKKQEVAEGSYHWQGLGFSVRSDMLWPAKMFESANPRESQDFSRWLSEYRESLDTPASGKKCLLVMVNRIADEIVVYYGVARYVGETASHFQLEIASGTHDYSKNNQLVFSDRQAFDHFKTLLSTKFGDFKIEFQQMPVMETQGSGIKKPVQEGLSWSSLGQDLSLEDKLVIFEEYSEKGTLTESNDPETQEYFQSLFDMSDSPVKNQKYVVVPVMLVKNQIMKLDTPSILRYLGQDQNGLVFGSAAGQKTYPAKQIRALSVVNTFTFENSHKYDELRTILSLKFNLELPEMKLSEIKKSVAETSYAKDLDEKKPVKVSGVKGMKSTPFTKKFRNLEAYRNWSESDESGNYEVHQVTNEGTGENVKEGYWADAVKAAEKSRAERAGKPFEKNPASHDEQGIYKGDRDLAGNPVPKRKQQDMAEGSDQDFKIGDKVRFKNRTQPAQYMTITDIDRNMFDTMIKLDLASGWWNSGSLVHYEKQGVAEGSILKSIRRGMQGWDKNAVGPAGEKLGDPREIVKRAKSFDTDTAKKIRAGLDDASDHSPAGLQKRVLDRKLKGVAEASLDPSGLQAAASMVRDYIVTAEVDGKVKKFRVRGMTGTRSAQERFLKHHSMARVLDVKPEQKDTDPVAEQYEWQKGFADINKADAYFRNKAHERGMSPVEMYGKGDAEKYRQYLKQFVKSKPTQGMTEASWTAAAAMHTATRKRDPQREEPKHNFRVGDNVITKKGDKSGTVVFVDGEKIHVKGTNPYYPNRVTHHTASELKLGVAEGRFDEPLTGWHIVSKAHDQVVRGTPSFETREQAQKYLMTKMFANHQDFKVVHTAHVAEGYWEDAVKKAEADREARKNKPFEPNPAGHVKGVYKGDLDLAGNPIPRIHNSFIITARTAEGDTKKYRVRADSEAAAQERFSQHHSQAQILSVKQEK
jgi:hypothetical protein